jgi:hypothetical protein
MENPVVQLGWCARVAARQAGAADSCSFLAPKKFPFGLNLSKPLPCLHVSACPSTGLS